VSNLSLHCRIFFNVDLLIDTNNKRKHFYITTDVKSNWISASNQCKACNKNLVTFDTREEAEYFMKATNESLWVGINDIEKITNPRTFVQVNGVAFPSNFPWSMGEPNNEGGNEHCVHSWPYGTYNDFPCSQVLKFACESFEIINKPTTTTTTRPTTTLSTTMTPKCPVRCSLDADFDEQVARQDDVNTKLQKMIDHQSIQFSEKFLSQENRLIKLELIVKEIGSKS
jgi:Lectin C-type domain